MSSLNTLTKIIPTVAAILMASSCSSQTHTGTKATAPTVNTVTKAVAHLGAWKELGLPGNSIAAFRQAVNLKCAGSEFDVNITADDSLVVSHGPNYHKLPIEKTNYAELVKFKFENGEKMPTLREFVTAGLKNNRTTLFFNEVKAWQISRERRNELAEKIIAVYKALNALDRVVFISFDYPILKKMVELYPKARTQYLNSNKTPLDLKRDGITGANYRFGVYKKHPDWIPLMKENDLALNSGTVNDTLTIDCMLANGFDYVSGDAPELVMAREKLSPAQNGWKLTWSDEFNGKGRPDSTKWSYDLGMLHNHELQYYTSDTANARLENGNFVLEARKETVANQNYQEGAKSWRKKNKEAAYTSARITTHKKAQWEYGKIEARAKLPKGRGLWPAIWMLPEDIKEVGWPLCGEIDIMEHVGFNPKKVFGTVHTKAFNHTINTEVGKSTTIQNPYKAFHVFAVEWSPEKIVFLLDGKKYHEFQNPHKTEKEWPFDKKFHLILNIAVGGDWGGQQGIDDSIFPQQMLVDYVRVYQKANTAQ